MQLLIPLPKSSDRPYPFFFLHLLSFQKVLQVVTVCKVEKPTFRFSESGEEVAFAENVDEGWFCVEEGGEGEEDRAEELRGV